jgi:hypothetical protein
MAQMSKQQSLSPYWTSATWWYLIALDALDLSEFINGWVWLHRNDPPLFVESAAPKGRASYVKRDRYIQEDCRSCSGHSWRRQPLSYYFVGLV